MNRFNLMIAVIGVFWLSLTQLVQAASSQYTKIDLDNCINISRYELGGTLHCSGYQGYGIIVSEGDLRMSVFYGHLGSWFEENAFESFTTFNQINKTLEWRLNGKGVPFATILRWFIENTDEVTGMQTKASEGQVLVVSRIGQPGDAVGCVVGYVDALENSNANKIARKIADSLSINFECGIDKAKFHGKRGSKTSTTTSQLQGLK